MFSSRSLFVVVLLMLCVTYSTSTKFNVQASDTKLDLHARSVEDTRSTMILPKENNDVVPTSSETGLEFTRHHGIRKLMAKRLLVKEEVHQLGTKCRQGLNKGMLTVDCDFRRTNINKNPSMKSKRGDFIAFDVDYHVPRPHPPKNN